MWALSLIQCFFTIRLPFATFVKGEQQLNNEAVSVTKKLDDPSGDVFDTTGVPSWQQLFEDDAAGRVVFGQRSAKELKLAAG